MTRLATLPITWEQVFAVYWCLPDAAIERLEGMRKAGDHVALAWRHHQWGLRNDAGELIATLPREEGLQLHLMALLQS